MKIAILYICTGLYDIFWKDFYISFEKNFITEAEKHYYVFTDASYIYDECNNPNIHKIYQKSYDWPYSTLKRYHIFMPYITEFLSYDYIFFMNANVLCVQEVVAEQILPQKENGELLSVVQHPYYYNKKPRHFTYDRNPLSTAYIPYTLGKYYICGGINGGTSEAFCDLIKTIYMQIESDLKEGIIALWHDESHINKYILNRSDLRVLSPSFCYPEDSQLPFPQILVVREKSNWVPVKQIKRITANVILLRITKIRNFFTNNYNYYKEILLNFISNNLAKR